MDNNDGIQINELRKTLEYAEAVVLLVNQKELDQRRLTIRKQLTALKRLSRNAVEIAKKDVLVQHSQVFQADKATLLIL
jgi:molybdopterin biosynthesis enzyme